MKEHPILFSASMVKAILEGRKTMTRRVIKHPERYSDIRECDFCCPYGQVGDRLWCRETICAGCIDFHTVCYRADSSSWPPCEESVTKPSSSMPRWASRITLEITGIKVEQVQEISEADAIKEGTPTEITKYGLTIKYRNLVEAFCELWDDINFKRGYSWASNPWVWVISFKVVKP